MKIADCLIVSLIIIMLVCVIIKIYDSSSKMLLEEQGLIGETREILKVNKEGEIINEYYVNLYLIKENGEKKQGEFKIGEELYHIYLENKDKPVREILLKYVQEEE